jgi:hypothetical protein
VAGSKQTKISLKKSVLTEGGNVGWVRDLLENLEFTTTEDRMLNLSAYFFSHRTNNIDLILRLPITV